MKKCFFVAVYALFVSATAAFGQMSTKDYDYKDFSVITVSGDFQVTLQTGDSYGVQVSVTEGYLPYLTVNQEGSTLVFGLDEKSLSVEMRKSLFSKSKAEFKAYVTVPDGAIDAVNLSGKAALTSSDCLNGGTFIVYATDGSKISKLYLKCDRAEIRMEKKAEACIAVECSELVVNQSATTNLSLTQKSKNTTIDLSSTSNFVLEGDCEYLSLTSKGSAKSELKGKSKDALYKCSGATNLDAHIFECGMLEVDLTGFCNIKVKVKDELTITMAGGAILEFAGEPAIDIKSVKNSSINRLK